MRDLGIMLLSANDASIQLHAHSLHDMFHMHGKVYRVISDVQRKLSMHGIPSQAQEKQVHAVKAHICEFQDEFRQQKAGAHKCSEP